MPVYQSLLSTVQTKKAGYFVLVDPDKIRIDAIPEFVRVAEASGVDALLVGGSLIVDDSFHMCIAAMKKHTKLPVIIFPGSLMQVSPAADAILFLSLLSGRNSEHIIGDQVLAAPVVKKIGLEAISTAYLLVESGRVTSAEFMSNTRPLPRHKPDIAVAHALAAEILGFKMIYLEAGSGALQSVPEEMIGAIAKHCSVPLIVGGGITTPEEASKKVRAGANFIVTGNVLEKDGAGDLMKQFADAIHHS
jgi:putative glycerol-1-phosphate prenyltransferase